MMATLGYAVPPTHLRLMRHHVTYSHVCTDEWRPTASKVCPLSLSR